MKLNFEIVLKQSLMEPNDLNSFGFGKNGKTTSKLFSKIVKLLCTRYAQCDSMFNKFYNIQNMLLKYQYS